MFKFSGRGSYSVQSMLTFVHWLFKSNTLKCAPLSIWSKLVQTMFKLCSKFKLCSNYVQSSNFVQTMFKGHICSNCIQSGIYETGYDFIFVLCSNIVQSSNFVQSLFKLSLSDRYVCVVHAQKCIAKKL